MKPTLWIFALAFDGLFFVLLYLWQMQRHEAAGSFFIGAMWFVTGLGLLTAFAPSQFPRTTLFVAYEIVTSVALILAIIYVGHVWLAASYGFVWLCMTSNRLKEKSLP